METKFEIPEMMGSKTVWESNSRQDVWSTEKKDLPNGEDGDMGPRKSALQATVSKNYDEL